MPDAGEWGVGLGELTGRNTVLNDCPSSEILTDLTVLRTTGVAFENEFLTYFFFLIKRVGREINFTFDLPRTDFRLKRQPTFFSANSIEQ